MCNCDSDRSFHNAVTSDSKWKFIIINILVIQNKKFIQLHKKKQLELYSNTVQMRTSW